jgi:hypothetical protein
VHGWARHAHSDLGIQTQDLAIDPLEPALATCVEAVRHERIEMFIELFAAACGACSAFIRHDDSCIA